MNATCHNQWSWHLSVLYEWQVLILLCCKAGIYFWGIYFCIHSLLHWPYWFLNHLLDGIQALNSSFVNQCTMPVRVQFMHTLVSYVLLCSAVPSFIVQQWSSSDTVLKHLQSSVTTIPTTICTVVSRKPSWNQYPAEPGTGKSDSRLPSWYWESS